MFGKRRTLPKRRALPDSPRVLYTTSVSLVLDLQLLLSTRTSENEVQSWQLKQNPTTVCSTLSVAHYTLHIGTRETWFPALVVDASVTRSLASLGNIVSYRFCCTLHIGTRDMVSRVGCRRIGRKVSSVARHSNTYRYWCTHETLITFINKFDSCYCNENYVNDCGGDRGCNSREDD